MRSLIASAFLLAFSVPLTATQARAATDEQITVDHATGTLADLRNDREFGDARTLLHRARAVLIAPRVFKAGFFLGGEGGSAVMLAHGRHGWSDPAFYTIASASFGLQFGAQTSEMVLFVMNDHALKALMSDRVKLGANAGIAVATLGSTVEGATTTHGGADIVVWASSSGAYAGISLDGSVVEPRSADDAAYYHRELSSADILLRGEGTAPGARALLATISGL